MKKKDKNTQQTQNQAQPASEETIKEALDIPSQEENETLETKIKEDAKEQRQNPLTAEENTENEEEQTSDTPEKEEKAVFDKEDWQDKVNAFLSTYPLAKQFANAIGNEIISDKALQRQDNCLEIALLRVLCKQYVSPQQLAGDENFIKEYIYPNESIRQNIVDEYLDGLQKTMPPKSITSRGQITLTPPSRPKSIAEAGAVITTMLNNRRI